MKDVLRFVSAEKAVALNSQTVLLSVTEDGKVTIGKVIRCFIKCLEIQFRIWYYYY